MEKLCKICSCILNGVNAVSNGIRNGKKQYKNYCKLCYNKIQSEHYYKNLEFKRAQRRNYDRANGSIKEYPCKFCGKLVYRKAKEVYCSIDCRVEFYIARTGGCWIWQGPMTKKGYALYRLGRKWKLVSHYMFEKYKQKIKKTFIICHSCDNPKCVNPEHLWQGTYKQNTRDMMKKKRQKFAGVSLKI